MFSVAKVRDGLARDDYADPGPYKNLKAPSPTKLPALRRGRPHAMRQTFHPRACR